MVRRRDKNKEKPLFLYNRVTLVVLLLISVMLASSAVDLLTKEYDTRQTRERKQGEYEETIVRKEALERSLSSLESSRGVEAALRSSFNVGREGEEVVVLLDPKEPPPPPPEKNVWEQILDFFK
jgi:hypothetical protein